MLARQLRTLAIAPLVLAAVLTAACDRSVPPNAPDAAPSASVRPEVVEAVELERITLHVSMVQLEGAGETPDWTDRTPRVVSMDPATGRMRTGDLGVEEGRYELVRLQVHRPPAEGPSVLLEGRADGVSFEVGLDVTATVERPLEPARPFSASREGVTSHVAVLADPERWLEGDDGTLNPRSASARRIVRRQVAAELRDHARVSVGQLARGATVVETTDEEFPVVVAHEDGSLIGISTDASGRPDRGVLVGANGQRFAVWMDQDGLPERAVAGEHVLVFDNYDLDAGTVDVGVVKPDGTLEVARNVELEEELLEAALAGNGAASVQLALQAGVVGTIGTLLELTGVAIAGAACGAAIASGGGILVAGYVCGVAVTKATAFLGRLVSDDPVVDEALAGVSMVASTAGCVFEPAGCAAGALNTLGLALETIDGILEESEDAIERARNRLSGDIPTRTYCGGNFQGDAVMCIDLGVGMRTTSAGTDMVIRTRNLQGTDPDDTTGGSSLYFFHVSFPDPLDTEPGTILSRTQGEVGTSVRPVEWTIHKWTDTDSNWALKADDGIIGCNSSFSAALGDRTYQTCPSLGYDGHVITSVHLPDEVRCEDLHLRIVSWYGGLGGNPTIVLDGNPVSGAHEPFCTQLR